AVFHKCPVCGEFAFIQPELGDKENNVFKCEKGHTFKKEVKRKPKIDDKEVWDHMPEWAKTLNDLTKPGK
ncbi:MAG: hypothetical protein ACFFDT_28955, partial [Candidatus Hodarchaeota archaeon]